MPLIREDTGSVHFPARQRSPRAFMAGISKVRPNQDETFRRVLSSNNALDWMNCSA